MIPKTIYERAVFIDTSALVAIYDYSEKLHQSARHHLLELHRQKLPLYITNALIIESYARILYNCNYERAIQFLTDIYDGSVMIERATEEDERSARQYLKQYENQKISYVDAISFVVMKRLGIYRVFTYDWHFSLIGFSPEPYPY